MKSINRGGLLVGLTFIIFGIWLWSLPDKHDQSVNEPGIFFIGVGVFFINNSLQGKSTKEIFHSKYGSHWSEHIWGGPQISSKVLIVILLAILLFIALGIFLYIQKITLVDLLP